ncbi:DUF500-domain-containing protein [Daldinia vernicosa]|uniref:DUF500-domain-containing protein n=1 Tax=Daldinia vernicosa TaxID=114800 RepID=UPI002007ABEB|nr:DUF500-domain-containing protein [Daldinia vernicosa]KAI0847183.1 DUF500-domain-containing protein [Daldinia vernicosa]
MSAHPSHSPIPGDNPNYYAELGENNPQPVPSQSGATQQGQYNPPSASGPPLSSSADPTYYPPPPPGPPPVTQHHDYYPPPPGPPPSNLDQVYYPPPPPGPPPHQVYTPSEENPSYPPPGYSEFETGSGITATDEKPPALPSRPTPSQGGQPAPHFPPPPTEASLPHVAAGLHPDQQHQQHQQQPSTTNTHAPASSTPKPGFGRKLHGWAMKVGTPINKLTNKLGSEAFMPTTMDKECDKAARILKSFCKDGFYTTASAPAPASTQGAPSSGPSSKSKVLVKIPQSVIANAKGLAIFTTFRTGFHISGAGGAGLVVARLPDGSWSPPAGFLVHTLGAGLVVGLDIYDCVCVLNTPAAVEAFAKPRFSLGGEVAVAAGPIGVGTSVEAAVGKGIKPVWSYMKSRGFYGGVQVDGTIIIQQPGTNEAFYGVDEISVDKILKGQVGDGSQSGKNKNEDIVMWPEGARQLMEVLKAAEGKRADEGIMNKLGDQPTPGDLAPTPTPSPGPEQQHFPQKTDDDAGGKTRFA